MKIYNKLVKYFTAMDEATKKVEELEAEKVPFEDRVNWYMNLRRRVEQDDIIIACEDKLYKTYDKDIDSEIEALQKQIEELKYYKYKVKEIRRSVNSTMEPGEKRYKKLRKDY